MKFKVETGKIKTRELVEIESGKSLTKTIDLMTKFAYTDTDVPMEPEAAREEFLEMNLDEIMDIQNDFMEAITPNLKGRR